jgi:hypothetical protein
MGMYKGEATLLQHGEEVARVHASLRSRREHGRDHWWGQVQADDLEGAAFVSQQFTLRLADGTEGVVVGVDGGGPGAPLHVMAAEPPPGS